jgi:hypothetical protein
VAAQVERWELSRLVDTASLLTSEIVTNVIRHTRGGPGPRIRVAVADGYLEIGVVDGEPDRLPRASEAPDPMATGGRGLAIVDALSDEWGTAVLPTSKEVWFRLDIKDWSYGSTCRCGSGGRPHEVVELASGRRVHADPGPWSVPGT